jgi:hypothetical protein
MLRASRAKPIQDPLGDDVVRAYKMTTPDQRQQVADDWDNGSKEKNIIFADLLQINPDGLLIASLLDAEHQSICDTMGLPRANEYGELYRMATSFKASYGDNSPKPVDNSLKSVDNSIVPLWITCGQLL